MRTQFDYLWMGAFPGDVGQNEGDPFRDDQTIDPQQRDRMFRESLRRGEFHAVRWLVDRYNAAYKQRQLPRPRIDDDYSAYPRRLLAMLWAIGKNTQALDELAASLGVTLSPGATYRTMPEKLLETLWLEARDGAALEQLWMELGVLPVATIDDDTPDPVVGFLMWYYGRHDARDALFARHHNSRIRTDRAQNRAFKLAHAVSRWEYLGQPVFRKLLNRSVRNYELDQMQQRAKAPITVGDSSVVKSATERYDSAASSHAALQAKEMLASAPKELIIEQKIRCGLNLTLDELNYAAAENLRRGGSPQPTPSELDAERARIQAWLAMHPAPNGRELEQCLVWCNQSRMNKARRGFRLRFAADHQNRLLGKLLRGQDDTTCQFAFRIQRHMDALVRYDVTGRPAGYCTVQRFSEMTDDGWELWRRIGSGDLDEEQADWLKECRERFEVFRREFPALVKLAPCWKWTRQYLAHAQQEDLKPILKQLAAWLEEGSWLCSISQAQRNELQAWRCALREIEPSVAQDALLDCRLLILWLDCLQETSAPHWRLESMTRLRELLEPTTVHTVLPINGPGPAGLENRMPKILGALSEIIAAAFVENWEEMADAAEVLYHQLPDCRRYWSPVRELRKFAHALMGA